VEHRLAKKTRAGSSPHAPRAFAYFVYRGAKKHSACSCRESEFPPAAVQVQRAVQPVVHVSAMSAVVVVVNGDIAESLHTFGFWGFFWEPPPATGHTDHRAQRGAAGLSLSPSPPSPCLPLRGFASFALSLSPSLSPLSALLRGSAAVATKTMSTGWK
jgi:hypothetical protein